MNDKICPACWTTRDKPSCLCRLICGTGTDMVAEEKRLKANGCLVLNDTRLN